MIPAIVVLAVFLIMFFVFRSSIRSQRERLRLMKEGNLAVAIVRSISQTGTEINQIPQMRLNLRIENNGGQPRDVEIKQLIDLGSMPRAGERVYVMIDPKNPDKVALVPPGSTINAPIATNDATQQSIDMTEQQTMDLLSLSQELRERGVPGVARVISIAPAPNGMSHITLDVDSIGKPLKRVTITQTIDGDAPPVGSRTYLIVDPQNPDLMALMPLSYTGGRTLPEGSNRLDPLALGPQLLHEGAKANGEVLAASAATMANPLLAQQGFSKWNLVIKVTPDSTIISPYQANLVISLTSKEKADKIAHQGAEVPLRYDPNDLQTISIDSIAMGYPDPYEETLKKFQRQR